MVGIANAVEHTMAREQSFYDIRRALHRSTDGQSGLYVFGFAQKDGRSFRITGYKNHRGLHYGLELATGKWVVLGEWEER